MPTLEENVIWCLGHWLDADLLEIALSTLQSKWGKNQPIWVRVGGGNQKSSAHLQSESDLVKVLDIHKGQLCCRATLIRSTSYLKY